MRNQALLTRIRSHVGPQGSSPSRTRMRPTILNRRLHQPRLRSRLATPSRGLTIGCGAHTVLSRSRLWYSQAAPQTLRSCHMFTLIEFLCIFSAYSHSFPCQQACGSSPSAQHPSTGTAPSSASSTSIYSSATWSEWSARTGTTKPISRGLRGTPSTLRPRQ